MTRPSASIRLLAFAGFLPSVAFAAAGLPNDSGLGLGRGNLSGAGTEPALEIVQPYERHAATLASAPPAQPVAGGPPRRIAATFVVSTAADTGSASLRGAITAANADANLDQIVFAIPGGGVRTILPLSPLPTISQPVVIDGQTQPGFAGSPLIEIDGTFAGSNVNGLVITAGGSTVRGLIINRFKTSGSAGYGVLLNGLGGNVVEGNWLGTNSAGTGPAGNFAGIAILLGSSNTIGGTTASTRNVLSGNTGSGLIIGTSSGTGNSVQGNYIGLNAIGAAAVANGGNGIFLNTASNTIGGLAAGAGNVISGNALPGLFIGISATATIVKGNRIGTDATGALDVGNAQNGINIDRASDCVIGDAAVAGRNVIAGNEFPDIYVLGPASGTRILGNHIGVDASGTIGLGDGNGVVLDNASNSVVGGTAVGAGNVISGHPFPGLFIQNASATGNLVQGNRIGTNASGTAAVGNSRGVVVLNAPRNVIGGSTPAAANVISGNTSYGIDLRGGASSRISGNFIGTDVSGLLDLGNRQHGVLVAASNDTVGGPAAAWGNVIAFNRGAGIWDSTGTTNLLRFNRTYLNTAQGIDLLPFDIVANDSLDGDGGVNNAQNFPLLDSTRVISGTTRIHGHLDSTPGATFALDFYRSLAPDTSHFGEAEELLGSVNVTCDALGRALFSFDAGMLIPQDQYVTAMATDAAGNSSEYSQAMCLADLDEDGILDCWERPGWPVDLNSDGRGDLDMSARGAHPDFQDVFVEIDAMNGYGPPDGAVDLVEQAFGVLPPQYLGAPPHVQGITLHPEMSDLDIIMRDLTDSFGHAQAVKDTFFGNLVERQGPNARWILAAKRRFFRYGLWARVHGTARDTMTSGVAEGTGTGGDMFVLTLGSICPDSCWNNTRDVLDHAGTFMHELGHTLGLRHGGGDQVHFKPNYYSVMNYLWQTKKAWQSPGMRPLDYSREALPTLNEVSLNEFAGFSPSADHPWIVVPHTDSLGFPQQAAVAAATPVDWTGNGFLSAGRVVDLNAFSGLTSPGQQLTGYQDWENLILDFKKSLLWWEGDDGLLPEERAAIGEVELEPELTKAMDNELRNLPMPQPAGIFVMDGQRDPTSMLVASNAGLDLYAAYRPGPLGGQLYVAAQGALSGHDLTVLVARAPGVLRAAPLAKAGQVADWDALIARVGTANAADWQDSAGTVFQSIVVDSAGSFLEGVVNLELLYGVPASSYSLALARYDGANGGVLVAQAPAGNGNGDLEANEWVTLPTSNVGVPGVLPPTLPNRGRVLLSSARPNPAFGASRVRLTLPAAADVVATVQNVAGRTVATLLRGPLPAGEHEIAWTPDERRGAKPAPGIYFIVVRALGEERTARVVVLD